MSWYSACPLGGCWDGTDPASFWEMLYFTWCKQLSFINSRWNNKRSICLQTSGRSIMFSMCVFHLPLSLWLLLDGHTSRKLSREDRGIKSVQPTTTRVPLTMRNQSEALPPGQRWNSCFTCDAHTGAEPDRLVMKQRASWLHYVSLKTKIPQRRCSFKLMCYRELRSSVHPSERLLADGWHSEQRAPNPL